jgi:hypothetical protein
MAATVTAAEASCSYDPSYTTFATTLESFVARSLKIGATRPSETADAVWWKTCCQTLTTAVSRGAQLQAAFAAFVALNGAEIAKPIYSDAGVPNDDFFKSVDHCTHPTGATRQATLTKQPLPSDNRGPVVYADMENARLYSACLPIGEVYRAAVKAYVAASAVDAPQTPGNAKRKLLPTLTLLDFYMLLFFSTPEDSPHRTGIEQNVFELCDSAEAQAPHSGPGAVDPIDSTMGTIDSMVGLLAGLTGGLGGKGDEAAGAIGGIGEMVKTVMAKMREEGVIGTAGGPPPDMGEVIDKMCKVVQSPDMKDAFAKSSAAAANAARSFGFGVPDAAPAAAVADTGALAIAGPEV